MPHYPVLVLSLINHDKNAAQSAGTVEYTDCISAGAKTTTNECPGYDSKLSDGKIVEAHLFAHVNLF